MWLVSPSTSRRVTLFGYGWRELSVDGRSAGKFAELLPEVGVSRSWHEVTDSDSKFQVPTDRPFLYASPYGPLTTYECKKDSG